jgi:hypothetical protein
MDPLTVVMNVFTGLLLLIPLILLIIMLLIFGCMGKSESEENAYTLGNAGGVP